MRNRSPNGSSVLKKPLIYSAIFHVVVLATLVVVPGIYIPLTDKGMKIDVMWVELPKGTGEEIDYGMKKAENLPQSTIEQQKTQFQPEPVPPQQQTMKPEIKEPLQKPVEEKMKITAKTPPTKVDPSKMTVTDKKAKPQAAVAFKSNSKMKNALASVDKALAGRQVVPEAAQIENTGQGFKYGTGNQPVRVSRSDPEFIKYQATVRAKIIRAWVVPTVYASDTGRNFGSRLEVMINMEGEVTSTRWAKQSGNASFDASSLRAIKNASPFPRPPDRLAWEAYNEGFLVDFDPRMKPQ